MLLAAIVWSVIGNIRQAAIDSVERATRAAAVMGALIVGAISFGLWQSWWLATLWLTAILLVAVSAPDDTGSGKTP